MDHKASTVAIVAGLSLFAAPATADEVFYYPTKDQSAEQLEKDKLECYGWAKGQTGFDPTTPAPTPDTSDVEAAQQAAKGSAVKGAARGAARGAAIGAIADDDAGKGAGIGAGAGAARGKMKANRQVKQAQAGAQAQYEQELAAYNEKRAEWQRASSACMEGRGYSVK